IFSSFAGFGLVLASATRTSPFGKTYSHRGFVRPSAKRCTVNPGGAVGVAPTDHLPTVENLIVSAEELGCGRRGFAPTPGRAEEACCPARRTSTVKAATAS